MLQNSTVQKNLGNIFAIPVKTGNLSLEVNQQHKEMKEESYRLREQPKLNEKILAVPMDKFFLNFTQFFNIWVEEQRCSSLSMT